MPAVKYVCPECGWVTRNPTDAEPHSCDPCWQKARRIVRLNLDNRPDPAGPDNDQARRLPSLWAYPVGCWLALLVPAVPLGLWLLLTQGPAGVWALARAEGTFALLALLLSAVLLPLEWVARLLWRRLR
jgi:hypothetical protein